MLPVEIRKELSDKTHYILRILGKNYYQLEDADRAAISTLYNLSNAWFPAVPSLWTLFEHAPKSIGYKFYYPKPIDIHGDLRAVAKSFLRASINYTAFNGGGSLETKSVAVDDAVVVWTGDKSYSYPIIISAEATPERAVFTLVVNVYE